MRLRAAGMILALGLSVAALASAQDAGPAKTGAAPEKGEAPKVAVSRQLMRAAKKAEADWKRRVDVCIKLRGIADETGDDELRKKVEKLEERAWDVYLAAKNAAELEAERAAPEPEAKKGGRK